MLSTVCVSQLREEVISFGPCAVCRRVIATFFWVRRHFEEKIEIIKFDGAYFINSRL